mmetsp:Transcript_5483/g.17254  ORF Transcript_5483/g.17254 Transcript_5483/m.17254 type:complete len:321 (-) Transcript_5483:1544-2506(-)
MAFHPTAPAIAARKAECPVCFGPLASEAVVVLGRGPRRTCEHYLHARCALTLRSKHCPQCGKLFEDVYALPALEDSSAWFAAIDVDGNGWLSRQEVLGALLASRPLDEDALERSLDHLWARWDANGDGRITHDEIFRPNDGLLAFAKAHCPKDRGTASLRPPPVQDRAAWFRYWDEDGSQRLDRNEVHRALVKTFELSRDERAIATMSETLSTVWCLFDDDGDGTVSFDEFVRPDGLGQTLAANLQVFPSQHTRPAAATTRPATTTTTTRPAAPPPPPPAYTAPPLPTGWELRYTPDRKPYYVNHIAKTTQWHHPTTSAA